MLGPRLGSGVVERSPGMRDVGGLTIGHVKQKLNVFWKKFEALLSSAHKS